MSRGVVLSPTQAINKTRNAILRMKKCSPELRAVLRQRCQERIHNDRLRILNTFRKTKIHDSLRAAFGNILKEEWKNIKMEESSKVPEENLPPDISPNMFNLEENLQLEEMFEKELLLEHEEWLLQLYEELIDAFEESSEVVCPLCRSGYLKQVECPDFKKTTCTKCPASFVMGKSLLDLQAAIYECMAWHDKQCEYSSGFVSIPKNEKESNLCIVCHHCLHLNVIE